MSGGTGGDALGRGGQLEEVGETESAFGRSRTSADFAVGGAG